MLDESIPYPAVPLVLYNGTKEFPTIGLLDSGSTDILLPSEVADILGIKIGEEENIEMIDGSKVKASKGIIGLVFGRGSMTFRKNFKVFVCPAKEVLLGRTFFRYFDITFKESNQEITLKQLSDEVRVERFHKHTKVH